MTETLKRREILRHRRDLDRVLRTGRRLSGPPLLLRAGRQPASTVLPPRRIAFLLSRRTGTAVVRNRLRRRLREIYRRNKTAFPSGHDYLLQAGPGAEKLSFAELAGLTLDLARKAASV
jgi:ribonuclease P protein component